MQYAKINGISKQNLDATVRVRRLSQAVRSALIHRMPLVAAISASILCTPAYAIDVGELNGVNGFKFTTDFVQGGSVSSAGDVVLGKRASDGKLRAMAKDSKAGALIKAVDF